MSAAARILILALVMASGWSFEAFAQASPGDSAAEFEGVFGKANNAYTRFWHGEMERLGDLDLYGSSAQLPKGYLSVKWQWDQIEAGARFDDKGVKGPVMPPIEFIQNGQKLISVDLGLSGKGGGHLFQISYGIIDELDWYIELPFTYMNLGFDPVVAEIDDDGNRISPQIASLLGVSDPKAYDAAAFLYGTIPALGRPTPATKFEGKWLLGDINTGFSWNYFRTPHMSSYLTPRVFIPSGRVPEPENNLTYGTGPELEIGTGGWGAGASTGLDFRLFKHSYWIDVIATTEITGSYFFKQKRDYPTNFVAPHPAAAALDPAAFPDLSDLEGTFDYTPGFGFDVAAQLQVQLAILGLGVGYGNAFSQEPHLDGDERFLQMAKSLELLGMQSSRQLQLGASLSLIPFYIPASVSFMWRKALSGYNAIVFDNWYQVQVQMVLPVFLLWD